MNKKTLFLILLAGLLILPITGSAQAQPPPTNILTMTENIKWLVWNVGVAIVFIGWTIAGILWLTSAGNPERTTTARKAIFAAVIGTTLVIFASMAVNIYLLIENALLRGT
jgi:hypothetical protein